jgi:multisubunit Na+/H+ antiporter MnhG subunit
MVKTVPSMFRYYWQILPDVFQVFQSTVRTAAFWVGTVLLTLAVALNQHWASWLDLKTFPSWVALLLLGAALLFALMRASYRRFVVEYERAERLETEVNGLRKQGGAAQERVDALARLRTEGALLRDSKVQGIEHLAHWFELERAWRQSVLALLREHFTEAEALSVEHPTSVKAAYFSGSVNPEHSDLRAAVSRRLEIIGQIIERRTTS